MDRIRLGFARLVLVYAALVFLSLASVYLLRPLTGIERFGITVDGSPESITFLRTSLGALFLGMAITAIYGLVRPARLRAALIVLTLFDGCIVAARLTGMGVDGVSERQWGELGNEGLSWIAFAVATWAAFRTGTASAAGAPAETAR